MASERRTPVPPDQRQHLFETFLAAAREGNVADLERLFASDVVSVTDGNGVAKAARIAVSGSERVARFISSFASHFWTGAEFRWLDTNGQPSMFVSRDGSPVALATIEASEDGINRIFWTMNPGKLSHIAGLPGPA